MTRPAGRLLLAAWCGAALFAASLAYFAYFYLVRLGRPVDVPTEVVGWHVTQNIVLFSVFALHHSVFARSGAKAWLARRLPPGAERSLYVWLASLLFLAVCLWWRPVPGVAWDAHGALRWLLYGLQLGGVVLTLTSASRIDIWELAGVRQARDGTTPRRVAAEPSSLEIGGPYRWVRHPIYFGWVLLVFAAPTMTATRLLFAGISTLYLVIAIPFEERSLGQEFGAAYAAYRRRVRWRLVPGVW